MSAPYYDFNERLKWSTGNAPSMEIVFKIMISRISGAGKIVKAELRDDRNGIDYFVEYNGLSPLTVDLKMSPKDPINEYGKDFSL